MAGIVDYASAAVLELRQSSGGLAVRLQFKNGTADWRTLNMFGNAGDTPLAQFQSIVGPAGVNSTTAWCNTCSNTVSRGCQLLGSSTGSSGGLSLPAAGGIGAGVTLAVVAALLAALVGLGLVSVQRRRPRSSATAVRLDSKGDDWAALDRVRP